MTIYELAILGDVSATERTELEARLRASLEPFGLNVGADVRILDGATVGCRNPRVAFAAAYFRGVAHPDSDVARALTLSSVPVIPVVGPDGDFTTDVPEFLSNANGHKLDPVRDPNMERLTGALLECLGLLRRQRRVFISYRRVESRDAAVQLHDELSANGFDVFLDTHDIQPGEPFQEMLWHRLCDSDVMVMLDTETYFERKWTRQELGRARALCIHVLQVIWPNHEPNPQTSLAETIRLDPADILSNLGLLSDGRIAEIVRAVECLRSRSVAARHMAIIGKLRAEAEAIGAKVLGIGANHSVTIELPQGKRLFAYPVVGVPTAQLLNDVATKALAAGQGLGAVLVYDHLGIRASWLQHMSWLDDHIEVVRAIKVREAGWALPEFE